MKMAILKRLGELERATERVEIPSLIIMSREESSDPWSVMEQYVRRDGKGNVAKGGYRKTFSIKNLEDYEPPKGFDGTMIIDNIEE